MNELLTLLKGHYEQANQKIEKLDNAIDEKEATLSFQKRAEARRRLYGNTGTVDLEKNKEYIADVLDTDYSLYTYIMLLKKRNLCIGLRNDFGETIKDLEESLAFEIEEEQNRFLHLGHR